MCEFALAQNMAMGINLNDDQSKLHCLHHCGAIGNQWQISGRVDLADIP